MTNENAILDASAEPHKAQSAFRAARALSELEFFDDAASRLYYAAFHLVCAALLALGVQAQTHAGVSTLLGQHLVKTGLLPPSVSHDLAALLGLRGQADYNRHFLLDRTGLLEEITRVEGMFATVETFLVSRGVR